MQPTERITRRHVLLTRAAGGIGRAFFRTVHSRYRFRLTDRVPIIAETAQSGDEVEAADEVDYEVIQLDLVGLAACKRACEQIDTVVHLAAGFVSAARFYESLLDNNIWAMSRGMTRSPSSDRPSAAGSATEPTGHLTVHEAPLVDATS